MADAVKELKVDCNVPSTPNSQGDLLQPGTLQLRLLHSLSEPLVVPGLRCIHAWTFASVAALAQPGCDLQARPGPRCSHEWPIVLNYLRSQRCDLPLTPRDQAANGDLDYLSEP